MTKKTCKNPEPSEMYSKDEFKNISFECKNCEVEVISVKKDKEFKWVHGRIKPFIEVYD